MALERLLKYQEYIRFFVDSGAITAHRIWIRKSDHEDLKAIIECVVNAKRLYVNDYSLAKPIARQIKELFDYFDLNKRLNFEHTKEYLYTRIEALHYVVGLAYSAVFVDSLCINYDDVSDSDNEGRDNQDMARS